jgi:hypothetical protein
MAKTITIYLGPDDEDIKRMIQDLRANQDESNPYSRRSESEVAKMLLKHEVRRQHERFRPPTTSQPKSKSGNHGPRRALR